MNILRRLPISRLLLLLCAVVVAVGIGATALASALGSGPTPPPKPLAEAIHDALAAQKPTGITARIQYTDHLLEGANLAGGGNGEAGQLSQSPLLSGASGRLWIGKEGHARLELQSEKGDTQILWDGKTAELYDASTNTLYRYTPPAHGEGAAAYDEGPPAHGEGAATSGGSASSRGGESVGRAVDVMHRTATTAEVEERIKRAEKHAVISGATPTDVAGQAAYTVRVSPREDGGLIGGGELSWDAANGVPLRAAIYSRSSSAPTVELTATEISYGQPEAGALEFAPPANAKVQDVTLPSKPGSGTPNGSSAAGGPNAPGRPSASGRTGSGGGQPSGEKPKMSVHGKGLGAIVLVESPVKPGSKPTGGFLEALPKVDIGGVKASELQTALGTVLTFERAGTRYLMAGSVSPTTIEAFARGL